MKEEADARLEQERNGSAHSNGSKTPPSLASARSVSFDVDDQNVARSAFDRLAVFQYLDADARPSFAIDLEDPRHRPIFISSSLRKDHILLACITGKSPAFYTRESYPAFKAWTGNQTDGPSSTSYAGTSWTRVTVEGRWRILQSDGVRDTSRTAEVSTSTGRDGRDTGSEKYNPEKRRVSKLELDRPSQRAVQNAEPINREVEGASATWSDIHLPTPPPDASDHMRLFWTVDWAETPLGPMNDWSPLLKATIQIAMCNPKPVCLEWGPERVMVYNEAYVEICGDKHPEAFGATFFDVYPEVTGFAELFQKAEDSKRGITCRDCLYFIDRHGFVEETYFTFSLIPLHEDGKFAGIYNPVWETTANVVSNRRIDNLFKIADMTAVPKDTAEFWRNAVRGFSFNEYDFPFAALYSIDFKDDASSTSHNTSLVEDDQRNIQFCKFEGATEVIPDNHILSQSVIDLEKQNHPLASAMRRIATRGELVVLRLADNTLDPHLVEGLRCPPFGDPCVSIVVCPIAPTTAALNVRGFAVIGLNPRLSFNRDYALFVELLTQNLGTSLASAMLLEDEMRRRSLEQANLEAELAKTSMVAQRAKMQFEQFADRAPVGINVFDGAGQIVYANEKWYETTMVKRDDPEPMSWLNAFVLEEKATIEEIWHKLIVDKEAVTFEGRLKRPWSPPGSSESAMDYTWIWASAYPDLNPDGSLRVIVGCFLDMSQQKWTEIIQTRRINDALEAKRLQEAFIDMTSHELRNPLSAVVHAADGIISLLSQQDLETPVDPSELTADAVASGLEAAKSIIHCSLHQKRIADDVLTASKLDSNLLPVAPDRMHLVTTLKKTLRMFESELKAYSIEHELIRHESFDRLAIDWVYGDPSRLAQIFVNLIANAIKFTQPEESKKITLHMAATNSPTIFPFAVRFIPRAEKNKAPRDLTENTAEWGTGEILYLHFAVQDTGPGLTDSECDNLFLRFSQATPRTHVQYGGSGLGLFISRELTELQGGEIGVSSRPGEGTTFAFYIKVRRAEPPAGLRLDSSGEAPTPPRVSLRKPTPTLLVPPSPHDISAPPSNLGNARLPIRAKSVKQNPESHRSSSAAMKARREDGCAVLYVEDNLVNRKVLSKQLRNLGFVVYEANHGAEALDFLRTTTRWAADSSQTFEEIPSREADAKQASAPASTPETSTPSVAPAPQDAKISESRTPTLHTSSPEAKPLSREISDDDSKAAPLHLILMDLEMPIMDGLTCMRHIRRAQGAGAIRSHVPTIAVTANARREQIDGALAAGMDAVVSKPFRLPELVRQMEEVVGRFGGLSGEGEVVLSA